MLLNLIANILDKLYKTEKAIALYINKPDSGSRKEGKKRGSRKNSTRSKYLYYNKVGYLEDSC
jgi:hypothetical protein